MGLPHQLQGLDRLPRRFVSFGNAIVAQKDARVNHGSGGMMQSPTGPRSAEKVSVVVGLEERYDFVDDLGGKRKHWTG